MGTRKGGVFLCSSSSCKVLQLRQLPSASLSSPKSNEVVLGFGGWEKDLKISPHPLTLSSHVHSRLVYKDFIMVLSQFVPKKYTVSLAPADNPDMSFQTLGGSDDK